MDYHPLLLAEHLLDEYLGTQQVIARSLLKIVVNMQIRIILIILRHEEYRNHRSLRRRKRRYNATHP